VAPRTKKTDEAARIERARRLRAQIEDLKRGRKGGAAPAPRTPRDFVEERMRDLPASDDDPKDEG